MKTPPSTVLPLLLLPLAACASHAITTAELLEDVRTLADDSFEGRGPGTRGEVLTREYIAAQLAAAGCGPGTRSRKPLRGRAS